MSDSEHDPGYLPAFGAGDTSKGDLIVIILFFGTILVVSLGTLGFFIYRHRTMEAELRMQEMILVRREYDALSHCFNEQIRLFPSPLFHPLSPTPSLFPLHHYFSLLLLLGMLGGLITVAIGLSLHDTPILPTEEDQSDQLASLDSKGRTLLYGAFIYVLCLNLYAITRQHLFRQLPRPALVPSAAYRPKDYETFDRSSWYNWVQIIVLVFEFIQLLSFPLRDLLDNTKAAREGEGEGPSKAGSILDDVVNVLSLLPRLSSYYYYIHLWTCFGIILLAAISVLLNRLYGQWARRPVSRYWVSYLIPIVMLLYLPILETFISSVACLAQGPYLLAVGGSSVRTCPNDISTQRILYTLLSLLAYTIGYLLLTLFVSSYDRLPRPGDMNFKSAGVLFMKNAGLFLVIDFLLIPTKEVRVRGVLSILILLAVVCYILSSRPCYVQAVNFWRTTAMSSILWVALLVPILDDESTGADLGFGAILGLGFGGMAVIFILYVLIHHFYRHNTPEEIEEALLQQREEEEANRRLEEERTEKIGLYLERQGYHDHQTPDSSYFHPYPQDSLTTGITTTDDTRPSSPAETTMTTVTATTTTNHSSFFPHFRLRGTQGSNPSVFGIGGVFPPRDGGDGSHGRESYGQGQGEGLLGSRIIQGAPLLSSSSLSRSRAREERAPEVAQGPMVQGSRTPPLTPNTRRSNVPHPLSNEEEEKEEEEIIREDGYPYPGKHRQG